VDSNVEEQQDSDEEYQSDSEVVKRKAIDYDLETMWNIIHKRDFYNWSLSENWKK
jgi:hypothetical protein